MGITTTEASTASLQPPLECDLVMKGGITSGVVYPLAVCELAKVYRLRSVGGSSAGAIAAAAAAAAEYGRAHGGFERLARLPHDLTDRVQGDESRLFTLFQPQPRMRRLFALVSAGLGTVGLARIRALAGATLRAFLPYAAAGAAPGVLLVILGFVLGGPAAWACLVAGLALAVIGLVIGIGVGVLRDVGRLPAAGFGLCSGFTSPEADAPALTSWLHETFQDLAGRTVADPPLTFGDLERAGIRLQLMTTNLSRRQPLALPWDASGYSFDPAHFRTLFPESVVARMETQVETGMETTTDTRTATPGRVPGQPSTAHRWRTEVAALQAQPLLAFPRASDLPIVVAVRMSLSFPGLITAVPLHAVDFSLTANKNAVEAASTWRRDHPDATPGEGAAALPRLRLQTNWFSDGGICANLPLHFFDSALPRRPTFAIDLARFPRDRAKASEEAGNSYLPVDNNAGLLRRQSVWPDSGVGALRHFFSSIIETARTWVDEAQLSMPGYRDRIVTVFHDESEGGMNLNMEEDAVLALSRRGEGAATRLVDRFAGDQPGVVPAPGWDNHRWLRFRTATAATSETLVSFKTGYEEVPAGTTAYSTWVGLDDQGKEASGPLPSYPLTAERRHAANVRTKELLDTAAEWQADPADAFTEDAPEPRPTMRLVPSDRAGNYTPLT
jgi:predicted acylesterase/phospholipase RssA